MGRCAQKRARCHTEVRATSNTIVDSARHEAARSASACAKSINGLGAGRSCC
jgi:hypothetical protein